MKKAIPAILLAVSVLFVLPSLGQDKKKLTLKDIWASGKFFGKSVYGVRSMNDGVHYTSLDSDRGGSAINKYSYASGEKVGAIVNQSELIPSTKKEPIEIEEYHFSADESKLMIATEVDPIYRHSTKEVNYIYDIKSKSLDLLSSGKQSHATFSPNGNKVAFVRDNNLFVKDLKTNQEIQITGDGKWNFVINGASDWVYEEEFAFDKAFAWSADGNKIAYYKFNEEGVKEFQMAMYGELYPDQYKFKYPKAGEDNSKVELWCYNLSSKKNEAIKLDGAYEYIPRIKWTKNPDLLSVTLMNRHQNELNLVLVNTADGSSKTILSEKTNTYIDITDDLTFLNGDKGFVWSSEKSGYNHIYKYDLEGKNEMQLTSGNWDVTSLEGVDQKNGLVYYVSAESSPMERQLYSVSLDGSKKKLLVDKKGTNRVVFSKGFKYFLNYHTDANTPTFVSLHKANGKQARVLVDNATMKNNLSGYAISNKEFFNFTTSENVKLNGWMIKPSDFDANKKYPVLMFVYGGPGAQTVVDSWAGNYMWHQYMAQQGYIIVSVDNRGTGARGSEFKKCTYKQLGKYETMDQIEAARYLAKQSYVDGNRIGIWGWSYGGYMSSLCITKGADIFKTAVAVAPVTNWRYYDSIYTERYMQTPQENPDGYDTNSPINHVEKLEGKYMLVHGSADDNVHYQNTMEMINALVDANKQFDLFIYPDRNHGIYGGYTRLHLFTKISEFITENL